MKKVLLFCIVILAASNVNADSEGVSKNNLEVNSESGYQMQSVELAQIDRTHVDISNVACNNNMTSDVLERRGCCSHHGGVCGCNESLDRIKCCDGTLSPSCTCSGY